MGLDPKQLLAHVVRPALAVLDLPGGELAEKLVMGTAAHESDGFRYIHQLGKGPALSLWQIEPATALDTLERCPVKQRDAIRIQLAGGTASPENVISQLPGNLYLGAALCRLVYHMKIGKPYDGLKPAKPEQWCASIWKKYYNTIKGAGTEAQFLKHWAEQGLDKLWP